jgi:hypothetical protein
MPTKRKPMSYHPRLQFSPEALQLFAMLEQVPRDQHTREFKKESLRLAALLGLTAEWWAMETVHTARRDPGIPRHMTLAREAWQRCREVREQLLEAVAEQQKKAPVGRADEGTRRKEFQ